MLGNFSSPEKPGRSIDTLPDAPAARATTLPSLSVLLIVIVVPESPLDPQAASGATAVRRISERHIARLPSCIVSTIHYDRTRCASRRGDAGPAVRPEDTPTGASARRHIGNAPRRERAGQEVE